MAKKKLSRDQKRKQKLQKRPHAPAGIERQNAAEKLIQDSERIIYETFISYGREMLDEDVLEAVSQLVVDIQHGDTTKQDASMESPNAKGALVWNIKQRWTETRALETMPHLVAAKAIQALAQRVDGIMAPGASHSYLRFLQGSEQTAVLAAAAVAAREGTAGTEAASVAHEATAGAEATSAPILKAEPQLPNGDWSDEEALLLAAGLTWLRGSSEATWQAFLTEAARLTESGQAQATANVSQYLYGLVRADAVEAALRPVLDAAHAKLGVEAEEDAEPVAEAEAEQAAEAKPEPVAEAKPEPEPEPTSSPRS